jgi:hypothetical protein
MLNKVSQQVLDAMYARLSSPTTGFNPSIVSQAAKYGIPANFVSIDWSATSQNFYFDQIDSELLEASSPIQYPFSCLYILDSAFTGTQKFVQFSGIIRCIFEVNLSWISAKGMQNREVYPNCVEDVVFDVINRVENQNWPEPLVYNGGIQCKRGRTIFGAQNWKKKLAFATLFEIHQ